MYHIDEFYINAWKLGTFKVRKITSENYNAPISGPYEGTGLKSPKQFSL